MIPYITMDFNLINIQGDILKRNTKNLTHFNLNAKIQGKTKDLGEEKGIFVMQK